MQKTKDLSFTNYGIGAKGKKDSAQSPGDNPSDSSHGTQSPLALSEQTKETNRQLVKTFAKELYDASAQDILGWAHQHIEGKIAVTLSMENTVLAELSYQHLPAADFLFLDTGYHFAQTLEVAQQVEHRYPQKLIKATPKLSTEQQDLIHGNNLYERDPAACCRMRKVEPLAETMAPYSAWITGLRRSDSPLRARTPALELDQNGRLKISPLVNWSLEETNQFIKDHHLIVHPLTQAGYPSMGCAPCTSQVAPGDDPRSGRWATSIKTECGLHT